LRAINWLRAVSMATSVMAPIAPPVKLLSAPMTAFWTTFDRRSGSRSSGLPSG